MRKPRAQDNKQLAQLARDDQKEREHFFEHPDVVTRHDRVRRRKAASLMRQGRIRTVRDHLRAALLFQHGLTIADYRNAQRFAQRAIDLGGGDDAKWLYAITTDRLLTSQGKRQRFGTQWRIVQERSPKTGRLRRVRRLLPVDQRFSDVTRRAYGSRSLKELLADDGKPAHY